MNSSKTRSSNTHQQSRTAAHLPARPHSFQSADLPRPLNPVLCSERKHLLWTAPHLTRPLPIVVPLYQSFPSILFFAPYYWAGVKAYDLVAGRGGSLEPSYWMSRRELRERFPQLKARGNNQHAHRPHRQLGPFADPLPILVSR
jgi:hypothetical protein